MGMLQGEIQVVANGGQAGHSRNGPWADVLRIGVQDAQPVRSGCLRRERLEQSWQSVAQTQIAAPSRRVLRNEDDFAHALCGQFAGFAEDLLRRLGPLPPLDQGDGTESTGSAASVGDLQIRTGAGARSPMD